MAKLAISTLWLAELARLVWTGLGQAGLAVVNCPECRRDSAALGLAHAGHEPVGYSFRTFLKTVFGDVGIYYLRLVDCFRFVQHATSTCMTAHLQKSRGRMCAK